MASLSTLPEREEMIQAPGGGVMIQKVPFAEQIKQGALATMSKAFLDIVNGEDLQKSLVTVEHPGPGAINPRVKGLMEPDQTIVRWGYDARGVREKYFNLSYEILREIGQRVVPIGAIQNLRCMQLRQFAQISYNENDVGFMAKLRNKNATADKRDKKIMRDIEEFFLYSGVKKVEGAEEREGLPEVIELISRDIMTIDQAAISLRRNKKGKLLDYWILDSATIKKIVPGKEKNFGNPKAKFIQEVNNKICEVFTQEDLIFTFMNRRTDIKKRGFGYSYLEMCIDMITAWLFAMAYNKGVFNESAQPKGILSFDSDKIDQTSLEELQRQWVAMFRGIKGMWKTPILQYGAKWIPISPNNRDMEFNEYVQVLSSWICAIHGVDSAEMGIRLNQAQNVMNENVDGRIAYSKDRGLKDLLFFHRSWINKILERVPGWEDYYIDFTGMESKSQLNVLEVDNLQIHSYMTLNEKRKEKDLPPLPGGDVVLDPTYVQMQMQQQQMDAQQQGQLGMGQPGQEGMPGQEGGEGQPGQEPDYENTFAGEPTGENQTEPQGVKQAGSEEGIQKSKEDDFIEIIL